MTIVFSQEDLRLFSEASGDRNPLHLSAAYARGTSFGQPVVFGALGALVSLSQLSESEATRVESLAADFHRPMFAGVNYRASRTGADNSVVIRLLDGSVTVLTVSVKLGLQSRPVFQTGVSRLRADETCHIRSWDEIARAQKTSGIYGIDDSAAARLLSRFSVPPLPISLLTSLLWSSYFIGMELPGERALFFRCVLKFPAASPEDVNGTRWRFSAAVRSVNAAVHQVRVSANLTGGGVTACEADLTAFYRPLIEQSLSYGDEELLPQSLSGKVALVLGGSRGLGAALSAVLARSGAQVISASRSHVDRSSVLTEVADVADPESLGALRQRIVERFGRLDLLVCNAFPSIPALRLEANALVRLRSYITEALDLTLAPMCVFLNLLQQHSGQLVVISSSAVETPVREWPHYVAAKSAGEMLARVASQQYENVSVCVFRPERMLTEMTNTPLGRANAASPFEVARFIAHRISSEHGHPGFRVVPISRSDLTSSPSPEVLAGSSL